MNTYIIFDGYQDQYMVMDGELPSDSYKIGTTFDEYLLGDTFVKLSEEQVRFHANNPSAGVREVWNIQLNTPTAEELLQQAKANKIAAIEQYDISANVNNFTINNILNGWLTPEERANYKSSIESDDLLYSKGIISNTTITFKISGHQVSLERTDAKVMLAQIQNYADACWLVTDNHKDAVKAMTDKDAVNAFNVTKGYPPMLNLTLNL